MTKEVLEKEAEEYADWFWGASPSMMKALAEAYIKGAEPREKRIKELEKENADLKTDYEILSCSVGDFGELQDRFEEEQRKNNGLSDSLTKAKELLKNIIDTPMYNQMGGEAYENEEYKELIEEAEQFLKDLEK